MYLQVERDAKACRVPTVNVSHYIKLAEIPSHLANDQERLGLPRVEGPPALPAGSGPCWPEHWVRTLRLTDRAVIKGGGLEGHGQTAREGLVFQKPQGESTTSPAMAPQALLA